MVTTVVELFYPEHLFLPKLLISIPSMAERSEQTPFSLIFPLETILSEFETDWAVILYCQSFKFPSQTLFCLPLDRFLQIVVTTGQFLLAQQAERLSTFFNGTPCP